MIVRQELQLEVGIAKICDTVYREDSSSRYTWVRGIKVILSKIRMASRQEASNGLEKGPIHDFLRLLEVICAASPQI